MKTSRRIGPSMQIALDYIQENPGCTAADVDRARRTAKNGHAYMYATIDRLLRAGLVERCESNSGRGFGLRVVSNA